MVLFFEFYLFVQIFLVILDVKVGVDHRMFHPFFFYGGAVTSSALYFLLLRVHFAYL